MKHIETTKPVRIISKIYKFVLVSIIGIMTVSTTIGEEVTKLKIPTELETNKEVRIYCQTLEEVVNEFIKLDKLKENNKADNAETIADATDALDITLKLYEVTQRIQQLEQEGYIIKDELTTNEIKAFSTMYANIISNLSNTDGKIIAYDYEDFSFAETNDEESKHLDNEDNLSAISSENSDESKLDSDKTTVNPKTYLYGLLIILVGVALAIYGLKKFGLIYAISFLIVSLSILAMFDWANVSTFSIMLALAVTLFFFTTPLTYIFSWFFGALIISTPFIIIYDLIGLSSESGIYKLTAYIAMIASVFLIYFIRKYLKAILVGVASGFYVGTGLAVIIFAKLLANDQLLDALTVPGIIVYIGMIGGLAFQYYYVVKKHPELVQVKMRTNTNPDTATY